MTQHTLSTRSSLYDRLFVQAVQELHSPRTLAIAAVLSALHLILNQFTIPVSGLLEVGFDFLATAAMGLNWGSMNRAARPAAARAVRQASTASRLGPARPDSKRSSMGARASKSRAREMR